MKDVPFLSFVPFPFIPSILSPLLVFPLIGSVIGCLNELDLMGSQDHIMVSKITDQRAAGDFDIWHILPLDPSSTDRVPPVWTVRS